MYSARFLHSIDPPWVEMEPLRLGELPPGGGTPERYLVVEVDYSPFLRVDLYASSEESYAFEASVLWSGFLAVGWGESVFLIELPSRRVSTTKLGSYFSQFHATETCLIVASAEQLFRIETDGSLRWKSECLGIDGVIVDRIEDDVIYGRGEWDPPNGWQRFRLRLETGRRT